jgi:hypothetical protein
MMTIPGALLGLVIAFLMGTLFHAVRGGSGLRLLLNVCLSVLGFALAQIVGRWVVGYILYRVGVLDVGAGVIGSLVLLGFGDWLSRIKPSNKSSV